MTTFYNAIESLKGIQVDPVRRLWVFKNTTFQSFINPEFNKR